jgi:signal peptidase I
VRSLLARPLVGWLVALTLLLVALVVVRATLVTPMRIASASMVPTFQAGDVVLVTRGQPELSELSRGDLVVFGGPEAGRHMIKRVLGLPGDVLVIRDSRLFVNERRVREPYVDHELIDGYYSPTYELMEGEVFVLGDNRGNSIDSRDYGAVPVDELEGRVLLRVWPPVRGRSGAGARSRSRRLAQGRRAGP